MPNESAHHISGPRRIRGAVWRRPGLAAAHHGERRATRVSDLLVEPVQDGRAGDRRGPALDRRPQRRRGGAGGATLGASIGAEVKSGAGAGGCTAAGAESGAEAGLRVARETSTRLAISSTITAMEASKATVTAARTCSSSTTATNGATATAGTLATAPGSRGAWAVRSFSAASASGLTAAIRALASKGLVRLASAATRATAAVSSVSMTPAVRITRTWRWRGLILRYWQIS